MVRGRGVRVVVLATLLGLLGPVAGAAGEPGPGAAAGTAGAAGEPEPSAQHAVILDGPTGTIAADRDAGGQVQAVADEHSVTVFASADGLSGHLVLPLDLGPGVHGDDAVTSGFRSSVTGSRACFHRGLELRLDELEVVDGEVRRISAAFTSACADGFRAAGAVVYGTTRPLQGFAVPSGRVSAMAAVGARELHRDVVLRNVGSSPQTLPDAQVTSARSPVSGSDEPGAGDWRVIHDGCRRTVLASGSTCTVRVGFTASATGPRLGRLLIDDARLGLASIGLWGWGQRPPPPPALLAAAETLGRVTLTVGPPDRTDTDVTSVVVRRRAATGGSWADLATLPHTRGYPASSRLWKRPSLGSAGAVQLTSLTGRQLDPAWSPDGRTVAFTQAVGAARSVWVVPAAGGTPRKVLDGVANPTWHRDGLHLIVEDHRASGAALVRTSLDGRRTSAITGTASGRDPAVSPDGRFLAFSVPTRRNDATLVVRHLDREGQGQAAVTDQAFTEPAWSVDGRHLVATVTTWERTTLESRGLGTFTVGVASHGDPVVARGDAAAYSPHLTAAAPRALVVHLTSAPARTGASASVGFGMWRAPTGTSFTCSLDGAKAQACTTPWKGTGLTAGRHRLTVEAREPGGLRTVTSHSWSGDTTPPVVSLSAPTATASTASRATVSYRATDVDGIRDHDVRYRIARYDGGFGDRVAPTSWQGTTATSRSIALARGREICFSVRARDQLGNRSAWSPERCTARPLDDRSLKTSSGWARGTGSAFLDETVTSTKRRGAELTRTGVSARQVVVVATRCPTCGSADVFIGDTRVGRLDLTATTTKRQQVIVLPRQAKVLTGTLTIRTTSTDRTVAIDGVAFRRT